MCQENILMKVISSYLDPTFPCFSPCRFYSICRCDVLLSESSVCRDPVAGESSVFRLLRWRHLVSGFLNSVPHGLLSLWACWQIIQQVSICSWKTKWCGIRLNQAKNIYRKCNRKQIILPGALSWITTRMPIMMFCVLLTCWSVCTHAHIRSYSLYYILVSVSPWKRTWYRQRDKVDFITLLFITFHWLIETMLDHVTVVFSYATAVVLKLKTQSVNIYGGFKG